MDKLFFILSVSFNVVICYFLFFKKNLLYIIPLIPFCGRWLHYIFPDINLFVLCYMELFLGLYFILSSKLKTDNLTFSFLVVLFLTTLIPFVNIANIENFISHLYYEFLFFTMFFLYTYIFNSLKNKNINVFINTYACIWVILSFVYKIISSFGFDIDFLFIRGGSSHYASNHVGYFLLTLLPFIKNKKVELIVVITLITFFSRGLILCLIVYYVLSLMIFRRLKLILTMGAFILCLFFIMNINFFNDYKNFMILRFIGNTSIANNIEKNDIINLDMNFTETNIDDIIENFAEDDRSYIWKTSSDIIVDSHLLGIGFGNFSNASKFYDSSLEYSNSHNLYLNIIAELGLLFFLIFVLFIIFLFYYSTNELRISLTLFIVYGFFSGQLYEASFEKSMVDFYHLLLLIVISRFYVHKDYTEQSNVI